MKEINDDICYQHSVTVNKNRRYSVVEYAESLQTIEYGHGRGGGVTLYSAKRISTETTETRQNRNINP